MDGAGLNAYNVDITAGNPYIEIGEHSSSVTHNGSIFCYTSARAKINLETTYGAGAEFAEFRYDENGKIRVYNNAEEEVKDYTGITIEELLNICRTRTGTYQECIVFVRDGKVDAMQFLED